MITTLSNDDQPRRQLLEELRHSEEKFRQLAENIGEVFWITDPSKNRVIYISPAYEAIWGRACETLVNSPQAWLEAVHPEDFDRVSEAAFKQTTQEYDETYRIVRPDGAIRWIHDRAFPLRNSSGKIYRIVGIAADITERKDAESALRRSESDFRIIFENAPIGMALVGEDGRPIRCNRAVQRMLGYTEADFRGMHFREFTHPDDVESDLALFQELVDGKRAYYQVDKRYIKNGGEVVSARLTVSMVHDQDRKAQYAIAMVEDVTETRKLEDQIFRAQRIESIGTLASGIAHDLNNILAPILMASEQLKDKLSDCDRKKLIDIIEESSKRGAAIIRQLLTFSRGLDGIKQNLMLNHLVCEVAHLIQETFPKSIEVQRSIPSDLRVVKGDATQIHQVLMNLCVNARDSMPNGGKLGLVATNACLTEEHAHLNSLAKPGHYVVLSVSDTGHGIPADIRERIFDPFFTTKEVGKGTGIGLSTVLGIVRSHGGFVTVYSEVGKGSVFKVYLPVVEATVIDLVKAANVEADGNGELVLVVDDEGPVRETARKVLEKHKFRVLTAESGEEALRLLFEHRGAIKLVLTDMMMPAIDGLHLIRTSRVLEPKVRFVAMSGLDEDARRSALSGLGVNEILFKPFGSNHLIQAVQRALAA